VGPADGALRDDPGHAEAAAVPMVAAGAVPEMVRVLGQALALAGA
jgi:hypothetical protein